MCAAEHDEFKSVCAALERWWDWGWELTRVNHFSLPYRIQFCCCCHVRGVCVLGRTRVSRCGPKWVSAYLRVFVCVLLIQREVKSCSCFLNRSMKIKSFIYLITDESLTVNKEFEREKIYFLTYIYSVKQSPHDLVLPLFITLFSFSRKHKLKKCKASGLKYIFSLLFSFLFYTLLSSHHFSFLLSMFHIFSLSALMLLFHYNFSKYATKHFFSAISKRAQPCIIP